MAASRKIQEQLDNLYSTTWQLMRDEAVDNIFNATPFWFWLTSEGRRRTEQGGRWIGVQLMYGKNDSIKSFSRGDTFDLTDPDIITTAKYDWKYIGGSVVRYWEDDQKNRGKSQILNLLNAKVENLKMSMIDKLESDLFASSPGPKDITSLPTIVRDTAPNGSGQDVVGEIDAFTHDWWQNKRNEARSPAATYLIADMRKTFNDCSVGNDTPNLLMTDQRSFELYEDEIADVHRIVDKRFADRGFDNLTFKGKPLVWAPSNPEGTMYFLNSRYLEWVADEFANFEMTEWKYVQNSLDRAAQVVVAGNLVTNNRRMLGVLHSIPAA